ncbi:MAG: hypothetical protein AAF089_11715 [Bacteroidota bacterium]
MASKLVCLVASLSKKCSRATLLQEERGRRPRSEARAPAGVASAQAAGAIGIASTGQPEYLAAANAVVARLADVHVEAEPDGLVVTLREQG